MNVDFNKNYAEMNCSLRNDGIHESVINVTADIFVEIEKMRIFFKVNFPDDKNDNGYRREYIKIAIDADKIIKGVTGNFVSKILMQNMIESMDYDPTFPLKKVENQDSDPIPL